MTKCKGVLAYGTADAVFKAECDAFKTRMVLLKTQWFWNQYRSDVKKLMKNTFTWNLLMDLR